MNATNSNYFLDTISLLRNTEEMLLFQSIPSIPDEAAGDVMLFLETEYDNERLEYPYVPPSFDAAAALWAAKTVYHAAQLILYRMHKEEALADLLPAYQGTITPSAILSADLCLRFIKVLLVQIKRIDPEDTIIAHLETHLVRWHYSGIGYPMPEEQLQWDIIHSDPCLKQLYIDRIIQTKDKHLATLPALRADVLASMGDFIHHYWKELII